ncbi:retron St85 family effector protein [Methylotenera sp.]|uniref:retron St85 family effector protein n=1 Tax=Methylotenera sp. TaxID=2051956 RepID=UPI002488A007|nr:retron St85 family effector protein [Methylotenera sp.]MDI1361219.1 retron St85 family effector protein [Methylotenera sp.]
MYELIKNKSAIKSRIETLQKAIINSRVFLPKDLSKFIFICGANKSEHIVSERRRAIMAFAKTNLPHTQFFLAEKMFSTLQKEGHKANILDIEHEISRFADKILIVLESPSTFTELGAFSHAELRSKLIVINDAKFKSSLSFINLGPLKAIEDASSKDNLIYYKMSDDGIHNLDAIGEVFNPLYELLKEPIKSKASSIDLDSCNPAKKFDKFSAMFVHDLLYLAGPLIHKEIIELLKLLFGGKEDFKLSEHLAILVAFESISRNEKGLYKSNRGKTFYEYKFDISNVISTFRNYTLKHFPERIYEY